MISSFSDAVYLIRPHPLSCLFKKAQFKRLLSHDFLQVAVLSAQFFDLISRGSPRFVASQPWLALSRFIRTDGIHLNSS